MIEHVNLGPCSCPACMQSVLVAKTTNINESLVNYDLIIIISLIAIIVIATIVFTVFMIKYKNRKHKVI
ncbi:hypothetical protein [Mycoplasma crocodyli]|uniref:hypothetical protein n=1 Tax=Mycoplasma crocodyli TaxID=50052 RepID=UPI0005A29418|nr:hypothetical protein [Mycoplasma crocodyli]